MKKTFKIIVSALCLSAILVGGTPLSASAYDNGGGSGTPASKPHQERP